MKRILITGMSGVGKSTIVEELASLGFKAIDLDTPQWSHWVDARPFDNFTPVEGKDWVWQEERVRKLLSGPGADTLIVSGCAENMSSLYPLFDAVILFSAPLNTILERLDQRPIGSYGRTEKDKEKIAALVATVEPRLRAKAAYEIRTDRPLRDTVKEVTDIIDSLN
jgi:dephospho-CoA kinase